MKFNQRLKRLKQNKGFSLVECIMAIAVLAIMSLIVITLLSSAASLRQSNISAEQQIEDQLKDIAQGAAQTTAAEPEIAFYKDGAQVAVIKPTDLSDPNSEDGISVNKQYRDDTVFPVDALDFDYEAYEEDVIEENGGIGGQEANKRVYGAADTSSVTVQKVSENLSDGVYTIKWQCQFNVSDVDKNKAIKVVAPIGAKITKTSSVSGGNMRSISQRIMRIEPTVSGTCTATFEFRISQDDYDNYYRSFANYMRCKGKDDTIDTSNTVTFNRQSDKSFKTS